MRYGILGTGMVGTALGTALVRGGHEVMMGSRSAGNEKATAWATAAGAGASCGSFADAAAFAEVVVNATAGSVSLDALRMAGAGNLSGKVLVDVANPIQGDTGFPPRLSVANGDSLAEQIQREFPDSRVVKTLNTVNAEVMVNPSIVAGTHTVFVCGNDADAKQVAVAMLRHLGWDESAVVDLGDLLWARGTEMYLILWLGLMRRFGHARFNVEVHGPAAG